MHSRPLVLLSLVAVFLMLLPAAACSSQATVIRADGSTARGTLLHADDDIVVLRNARLTGSRNAPAPFTNRRGRRVRSRYEAEIAIPRADIVRLTSVNRRARNAGIAGSVITGVSLIILVPSALALQSCDASGGSFIFDCDFEKAGVGIGSIMLIAGLVTGITGWVVYASSYRDEAGEVVPLAPSTTDAALFRF